MLYRSIAFLLIGGVLSISAVVKGNIFLRNKGNSLSFDRELIDDLEFFKGIEFSFDCIRATFQQLTQVNLGNQKIDRFLSYCRRETHSSAWCNQLARPNPASHLKFDCTYSESQAHFLVNPEEKTWVHAISAVKLVTELEQSGIKVCQIYNWWRPEPYNKNVGGAAGRHPFGTSVDVRFCSDSDADRAFDKLCKFRKEGRIRAIGHYGSSALHFGIGDQVANTWGRECP